MKGAHKVVITVKIVFLVVTKSNLAAAVLREKHSLALFHGACTELTIIESFAWANSDHNTEVKLLLLALGEEDATLGLGEGLSLLDEDAVHQGT